MKKRTSARQNIPSEPGAGRGSAPKAYFTPPFGRLHAGGGRRRVNSAGARERFAASSFRVRRVEKLRRFS
jgi:hypothetical protein